MMLRILSYFRSQRIRSRMASFNEKYPDVQNQTILLCAFGVSSTIIGCGYGFFKGITTKFKHPQRTYGTNEIMCDMGLGIMCGTGAFLWMIPVLMSTNCRYRFSIPFVVSYAMFSSIAMENYIVRSQTQKKSLDA